MRTPLYSTGVPSPEGQEDPKAIAMKELAKLGISLQTSHINTTRHGQTSPRIANQRGGGPGNMSEASRGFPNINDPIFLGKLRGYF